MNGATGGVTPLIGTRARGPDLLMLEKYMAEAVLQVQMLRRHARIEDERIWLTGELEVLDGVVGRVRAAIAGRWPQVEGMRVF